jgi:hypothetical protein
MIISYYSSGAGGFFTGARGQVDAVRNLVLRE